MNALPCGFCGYAPARGDCLDQPENGMAHMLMRGGPTPARLLSLLPAEWLPSVGHCSAGRHLMVSATQW